MRVEGGEWAYAKEKQDDEAIKAMYPERDNILADEDEEEEDSVSRESGVRAATLSIHRRDDKMRWVFGGESPPETLLKTSTDESTLQTTFNNSRCPTRGLPRLLRPLSPPNVPLSDASRKPWDLVATLITTPTWNRSTRRF